MNNIMLKKNAFQLYEYAQEADKINMMDRGSNETYETAPLPAVTTSVLSDEELHILFESAINNRLLAMREQILRISGPLSPLPEPKLLNYNSDILPFVHTSITPIFPVARVKRMSGTRLQTLFYCSLALMLATLGFDIMGLIVLYLR